MTPLISPAHIPHLASSFSRLIIADQRMHVDGLLANLGEQLSRPGFVPRWTPHEQKSYLIHASTHLPSPPIIYAKVRAKNAGVRDFAYVIVDGLERLYAHKLYRELALRIEDEDLPAELRSASGVSTLLSPQQGDHETGNLGHVGVWTQGDVHLWTEWLNYPASVETIEYVRRMANHHRGSPRELWREGLWIREEG